MAYSSNGVEHEAARITYWTMQTRVIIVRHTLGCALWVMLPLVIHHTSRHDLDPMVMHGPSLDFAIFQHSI